DAIRPAITLTAAQQRAVDAADGVLTITGPAASGKTTALAARALAYRRSGCEPLIVCSHESGCEAFGRATEIVRGAGDDPKPYRIATLAEHAARWLSSAYLAAAAAPNIAVGGKGAARFIVQRAAKDLLDMTWPMFARADINLDLPHLSRPDAFLDEAASLFSLLQRSRVTPQEFEEGCAAGLAAFYGQQTERASLLLQDPVVRNRASARGRDACRASAESLRAQRRAERDTAAILAQLYRDYRTAAATAGVRSPEDIVDAVITWLSNDERAALALAAGIEAFIVDDAEDAEPGLAALLHILRRSRAFALTVAGCEASRVDGFEGRRSTLAGLRDGTRIELGPLAAPATINTQRFSDEAGEADWLASQIGDLLRQGTAPENIAVLSRAAQTAAVYARLLRERGVATAMPTSMLERDVELADLLALCAVIDDPADQEHLLRVLSSPIVGLSDASLLALCRDPADRLQLSLEVGAAQTPVPSTTPHPYTLARNVYSGDADSALPES
ncbi:MAG TPA: 3'-5' exonuclease, partial [Candidatus Eremiobacteraceae bacterium]|nr:3'-5' exonuclease [Candidatus Eremiobacteraceae bacterium]